MLRVVVLKLNHNHNFQEGKPWIYSRNRQLSKEQLTELREYAPYFSSNLEMRHFIARQFNILIPRKEIYRVKRALTDEKLQYLDYSDDCDSTGKDDRIPLDDDDRASQEEYVIEEVPRNRTGPYHRPPPATSVGSMPSCSSNSFNPPFSPTELDRSTEVKKALNTLSRTLLQLRPDSLARQLENVYSLNRIVSIDPNFVLDHKSLHTSTDTTTTNIGISSNIGVGGPPNSTVFTLNGSYPSGEEDNLLQLNGLKNPYLRGSKGRLGSRRGRRKRIANHTSVELLPMEDSDVWCRLCGMSDAAVLAAAETTASVVGGTEWVRCDLCLQWTHVACTKQPTMDDQFVCDYCV